MDIHIFWDRRAPEGLARPVTRSISSITGTNAIFHDNPVTLNGYTGQRRQVDASVLLDTLGTFVHRQGIDTPVLLVVGQDMFITGLDFVFGLARQATRVSVVSGARLTNEYYDRPRNDDDLVERLSKEGSHEIGHLFGLEHCRDHECIMYNPHTLDDLDGKKQEFCPGCQKKLRDKTI